MIFFVEEEVCLEQTLVVQGGWEVDFLDRPQHHKRLQGGSLVRGPEGEFLAEGRLAGGYFRVHNVSKEQAADRGFESCSAGSLGYMYMESWCVFETLIFRFSCSWRAETRRIRGDGALWTEPCTGDLWGSNGHGWGAF